MAGSPRLARVALWAGAIVLAGAAVLAIARRPNELRSNPECLGFEACEAACDGGKAWACSELAGLFDVGSGVAKNPLKAVQLWSDACDAGSGNACFEMSTVLERGTHGYAKNEQKAQSYRVLMFEAFERECSQGFADSCFGLANSYESGIGTPVDTQKAAATFAKVREFWEAGCAENVARHCGRIGLLYATGLSIPTDLEAGLQYREKACELGHSVACALGGYQAKEQNELERARTLLTRACELERASSCEAAAELTDGTEAKLALYRRRAELYGSLCENQHVHACWIASNIHVDTASLLPRDEDQARAYKLKEIALREAGCKQDAAEDCASLATTFEMGKLVPRDIVRAQELVKRACKLGDGSACETERVVLDDVVDVSLGYHSCVVKGDGSVWCWGQNRDGQLGDGTKEDRDRPVQAQGAPKAVAVDLYGGTTCIRTRNHQAWCWGAGFDGVQRIDGGQPVTEVATGFDLACALRENGDVGCSGYDASNFELGASAVRVGGLQRCAIASGKLLCWGSVMQEFVADPKPVVAREDVVDASVSSEGFCAIFKDGTATCRAQVLQSEPTRVVSLTGVRLIGGDADAGCAMKSDELWCWYLREGLLKKPFLVKKLEGVTKVVVRSYEGCALTDRKELFCWYVFNPEPEPVTFQKHPSDSEPPAD